MTGISKHPLKDTRPKLVQQRVWNEIDTDDNAKTAPDAQSLISLQTAIKRGVMKPTNKVFIEANDTGNRYVGAVNESESIKDPKNREKTPVHPPPEGFC